jgi:geranylgeranyl reductase family protein
LQYVSLGESAVKQWDFAVVGGGPSGSSAARSLAKAGASVVLFEREEMPRRKSCGGALSARAMRWLGFSVPDSLVDAMVFGARIHFGARRVEARSSEPIAVLVTRSRFDQFLLSKARECGAEVVWKEVTSIRTDRELAVLCTADGEFAARCVILCEGARCALSRIVRRPDRPRELGFCIAADVPVAEPHRPSSGETLIDFYFGVADHGYAWAFDHGTFLSVGVGGAYSRFRSPLAAFREFLSRKGIAAERAEPRGHFIPCGGVKRRLCSNRVILAGDAAGFVDPFLGEGLPYAIRSGQIAGEVALQAARQGDFSSSGLAPYARQCRRQFGANLRHALLFTRMVHAWPSLFLRMLASDEEVLRRCLEVPAATMTYRRYAAWMVAKAPVFLLGPGAGRGGRGSA